MSTLHRDPVQILLPLPETTPGKLEPSRKPELISLLAELLLLAASPAIGKPGTRCEVCDEAH